MPRAAPAVGRAVRGARPPPAAAVDTLTEAVTASGKCQRIGNIAIYVRSAKRLRSRVSSV